MGIRDIKTLPHFDRQYKKLPQAIKEQAKNKERIFRKDPFDSHLKTHKLHGRQSELWAFWINYSYRITFIFLSENAVLFLEIGAHDIYE